MASISNKKLSVYIITLNEEKHLPRCLSSVKWADEIIVVDSGSQDATVSICKEFGCSVFHNDWIDFAHQKSFALGKCNFDWVLSIDADEEITENCAMEVEKAITSDQYDAYIIPRKNFMYGRWMRSSNLYPDYQLRLGKRSAVFYKIEEQIHESLYCNGSVGRLKEPFNHYTLTSYKHRISKSNNYSDLMANMNQNRVRLHHFFTIPIRRFFVNHFIKKGYRDGVPGLIFSIHSSFAEFATIVKRWEKQILADKLK